MKPMDVEEEVGGDINLGSTICTKIGSCNSSKSSSTSATTGSSSAHSTPVPALSSQMSSPSSSSSGEMESSNFLPSAAPPPAIPLVLDNITNSPRSLIQDVFSNSPTIKCHDEDRLTAANTPVAQMQQPVGDFIKGICF